MSQLCRGSIVWMELPDPQGHNLKSRPAVIVTPDAEIQAGGEVRVVGISTQFASMRILRLMILGHLSQ